MSAVSTLDFNGLSHFVIVPQEKRKKKAAENNIKQTVQANTAIKSLVTKVEKY